MSVAAAMAMISTSTQNPQFSSNNWLPYVYECYSGQNKIRRAFTKMSARFGSPNQMRITPVALLTEVVHFAVRNEDVFLTAR
ncbi:hypothetical protein PsorP6_014315 [Peronosclerospora sorghi]|uniref:Uncharacterized protein n=1 Tax=Peronosclerospora sorghi TaxID=230839 RepID=A0ACC0VI48_9STRA|nr:hypothetical protein PsorP6_014315 [Peronosclerospora sorghi]